jgi:hypothetical protein
VSNLSRTFLSFRLRLGGGGGWGGTEKSFGITPFITKVSVAGEN